MNQEINQLIMEKAKEYESYVIQQRRHFHTYAEVTAKEFETSKYLKEEAAKLGLPIQELKGTGFIATLDTGRPGKTLAIRSDIDALPLDEDSENLKGPKTCVSVNPGACHACGHDAHMAIALGAMKVLCDIREQLSGKILFAFEEGEEQGTGWPAMSEALIAHKIDAIYGNHVTAFMDAGTFCADEGPRMAGAIGIEVTVNGKSGHGSRPDLAVNPIVAASQIVTQLNTAWSTRLDVTKTVTLSVCMFQAGHMSNIIPDSAFLGGSCRYFDIEESHKAAAIIEQVAEGVAAVNECTVTFGKKQGIITTPVMNTPELAQLSQKGIQEMMPKGSLVHDVKWFASEPFSRYYDLFPCMFNFIGVRNEEKGCGAEHHNGKFDIDEDALQGGVAVTAKFAVDFLAGGKGEADD